MIQFLSLFFCVIVLGCSNTVVPYYGKIDKHMINIDRNGNYVPYEKDRAFNYQENEDRIRLKIDNAKKLHEKVNEQRETKDTEYDQNLTQYQEIVNEIQAIKNEYDIFLNHLFEEILKHKPNDNGEREILVFIHGGLNEEADYIKRVHEQYDLILNGNEKMYPIFINWLSSGYDSYKDHLVSIRQGKESNSAWWSSSHLYLFSDVIGSIAYAPKSWVVQGKHTLDSYLDRKELYGNIKKIGKNYQVYSLVDENTQSTYGREAFWVLTSPFKIVTTPFVYTMSKPAWDIMLRRSKNMFRTSNEYGEIIMSVAQHESWIDTYPTGTGSLSIFFDRLSELNNRLERLNPKVNSPIKIALYGHSMGVIICNDIVDLFPKLNFTRIVHMASADSIRNFYDKTIPYIERNEGTEYYSLHLAPINEDREVSGGGMLPSGSLLTWIDNSFTTPPTELDRRAGRWNNIKRTLYLIPQKLAPRVHFKIFGVGEKMTAGPQKHGEFDDVPYWEERIYWK